jgi:hypothetical protein
MEKLIRDHDDLKISAVRPYLICRYLPSMETEITAEMINFQKYQQLYEQMIVNKTLNCGAPRPGHITRQVS